MPSARSLAGSTILLCLALLLAATPAHGQAFELGDDDQWLQEEPLDPDSPEQWIVDARSALAAGDAKRAQFLAGQYIDRHPDRVGVAEAYVLRGDALRDQREFYKALFDYEYVARSWSGSEWFVRSLERELEIAKVFLAGTRRKFLGVRWLSAESEAEELLIRVQERLPGSALAEDAALTLANHYFLKRKMDLAAEMYSIFIENFPRSEHIADARKRLIYSHLAAFKGPEFDGKGLTEARTRLRELQAVSPSTAQRMGADALLMRIDDSLAAKRLATAKWYAKTGDYVAAELTIRRLLEKHPRSVAAVGAVRLVVGFLDRMPAAAMRGAPDYRALAALFDAAPEGSGEPEP